MTHVTTRSSASTARSDRAIAAASAGAADSVITATSAPAAFAASSVATSVGSPITTVTPAVATERGNDSWGPWITTTERPATLSRSARIAASWPPPISSA